MEKKIPVRMCVACRGAKPKNELIRIVRNADGSLQADITGKKNGRGAYVCKDMRCIQKAKKIFPKIMRCPMSGDLYESLTEIVKNVES